MTVFDVPAEYLIDEVAEILKKDYEQITPLDWVPIVKTGVHKENPPQTEDWWYVRCASILRKLYILNVVGINKLRNIYGGKQRRGPKPNKFKKGSGSIIRNALHQLESAGLVKKIEKKGRALTPTGRSFLDRIALQIKMKMQKTELPGLAKY